MLLRLRNCSVLDPQSGLTEVIDVGIQDGKVSALGDSGGRRPDKTVDIGRRYLVPALVDLHTHVYHLGTSVGVNADDVGRRSGVGAFVDAGSAGAGNFAGFREHVIKRSSSKIYSFLNIGFGGIPFFGIQRNGQAGEIPNLEVADTEACLSCVRHNPQHIVGIKVRLSANANGELGVAPLELARKCARASGLPLMVHFGSQPPPLTDVLSLLGTGDILTHSFRPEPNSFIEGEDVSKSIVDARKRGVLIDIGHGSGSFSYKTAATALEKGFLPDTISTDIHSLSMKSPVHDLPTTMTKFLNLGMKVPDTIKAVTYNPSKAIRRPRHGQITEGVTADLVVLEVVKLRTTLKDSVGAKMESGRAIRPTLRIRGTEVSRVPWKTPRG